MTIQIRRALFALALGFSLPLPAQIWAAPAQVAPETTKLGALVRDAQGKPIVGADVVLVKRDGESEKTESLKTDAQGRFSFDQSASKAQLSIEIFVGAPGYALQRALFTSLDKNEITLKPGVTATGKVVDADGKPVADARVALTMLVLSAEDEPNSSLRYVQLEALKDSALEGALAAKTDADGVWRLADLPVGSQGVFQLDDPRFARADKSGVAGEKLPDFKAVPGASLKGRVVNAEGKPVADARINANVGENGLSSYASTATAPDGTYSLEGLPEGNATIKVSSPNSALAPTSIKGVAVTAGQTATAPEIRLNAGVLLTGEVLDKATKKPVEGARVMAMGDFGNAPSAATGKDGIYQVRVPTGQIRFYLYSQPEEYVRDMFTDANANITAASTNAPDFAIQRGLTLTGTARDETGAPAVAASINAGNSWDGAPALVDEAGNWTLKGVNPQPHEMGATNGKVRLETSGDWQIVGDGLVAAREGAPVNLTLQRIERRDVTLRVVTPDGEPVEGASVRVAIVFDPRNHSTRFENAISNARGEVTVKKLRPDESAEITPEKEGYALQKTGVISTLDANKARTTDAILTPKNGMVRGRIVDAAGVAVAGASVAVLWPGDLRNAKTWVQSDANGKFELGNLRAGELLIGAARGRDYGQVQTQTGGDVEIKLKSAAPQPAPENRALAREMLAQWFAAAKQNDATTLTNYAASIAGFDGPESAGLVARSEGDQLWFEQEQTPELAQAQAERALAAARAAVNEPKKPDEHQSALLDLATLLVQNGDLKSARETYDLVAPNVTARRGADPEQAMWDAYKYAQLAGIAGAIEHPGADYWLELLDRSLEQMSADDRLFRIGGYAEELAKIDVSSALNWLETRAPAEQVRSYEDVIPVVAARDLPRAQELLAKMEALVARGDIPVEPDRDDAMYRPTPAHSLNVARISIIEALLPIDARAAYEQATKLTDDNYELPDYQTEAALRLPAAQALPILRAQFVEAQDKSNRSVAAMARLAKLVAPLDAKLSEQWFEMARQRLADNTDWNDDTREMAAAYAFYRADSDAAQSRLLLENEWQRNTKKKSEDGYLQASRLRYILWAMVPVDWERALQMLKEGKGTLDSRYADDVTTQHNLTAWLLASERERREVNFDGASAELLNGTVE